MLLRNDTDNDCASDGSANASDKWFSINYQYIKFSMKSIYTLKCLEMLEMSKTKVDVLPQLYVKMTCFLVSLSHKLWLITNMVKIILNVYLVKWVIVFE